VTPLFSPRYRSRTFLSRPYLWVIATVAWIVPRRLRDEWRSEWEAELRSRERRLAEWDQLDRRHKRDLVRRSSSAFWDALWLQRRRTEDEMVQDLRFGLRMLSKNPTFTTIAVLTLALGIGANTAVFSFVNALLLRPLDGVARPHELVQVGRQYPDKPYLSDSSYPDYLDYRAQNTVATGLAVASVTAFHLSTGAGTERVDGELVSGDYFDVLGVAAVHGRLISREDDHQGAEPVAVISSRLWRRRFGGTPAVVGTRIRLNGQSVVVIGVAGEPFTGIRIGTPRDLWVPLSMLRRTDPEAGLRFANRHASWLEMFGRLKPGVTLEQARTEFSAIAQRLEREHPTTNARAAAGVEPDLGRDVETARELRRFAYLPFAAVAIVLLIACANVAGLLLARAATRHKEIATRLALGAGRVRIIRQLLTESLTLALTGGVAGLVAGRWLTGWLQSLLPERYLFLSFDLDFGLDWRVFAFTAGIAVATGLVFGLVPALHASRPDVVPTLKSPGFAGRRGGGELRAALIVSEVALSLVLLIAAGLCVRTLINAAAIETGYETHQVLSARIDLKRQNYTQARGQAFHRELLDRLHAAPGVQAAGFAVTLPLNDGRWEDAIRREGDPTRLQTFQNVVSPRYFDALRIPLVLGRLFTPRDDERSPKVAILNQTLAQLLWADDNPIGRRATFRGSSLEVIGVVRDIKGRNLFEPPGPMLYLPLWQHYEAGTVLHVRADLPPKQAIATLQREIGGLDKDLPVYSVKMLDEHVTATLTPQRLLAHLVSGFGVLALLLAAIGLYALLAYTVTERTGEIGIRMALGAQRRDVVNLFVTRGMKLAAAGIVLGFAAAFALTRLMTSVLFGVSPLDPLTLMTVLLLLTITALLACYIPARRAACADPKTALRVE
jgi:predicted permease